MSTRTERQNIDPLVVSIDAQRAYFRQLTRSQRALEAGLT